MESQGTLSSHNHTDDDDGCVGGAPDAVLDFQCGRCGAVVGQAQRFADGYGDHDLHWEAWEVYPARIVRDGPNGRRLDFLSLYDVAGTRHGGRRRRHAPKGVQWECWRNKCGLPSMPLQEAAGRAEVAYRLDQRAITVG